MNQIFILNNSPGRFSCLAFSYATKRETGWRAPHVGEGTVRLSPKGESDRITPKVGGSNPPPQPRTPQCSGVRLPYFIRLKFNSGEMRKNQVSAEFFTAFSGALGVHALHLAELTCYMTANRRLARSDDPELRFSPVSRVAATLGGPGIRRKVRRLSVGLHPSRSSVPVHGA